MSTTAETKQYLTELANFLERDLNSDNPVRQNGAIRRLARVQPNVQGMSVASVRQFIRRTDFLDAIAVENGYSSWREVEGEPVGPVPEVNLMAAFSTAHITQQDAECLEGMGRRENFMTGEPDPEHPVLAEYPEGFILYVGGGMEGDEIVHYEEHLRERGLSDNMIELTRIARRHRCRYLMLDRDVETIDGLPVHDW